MLVDNNFVNDHALILMVVSSMSGVGGNIQQP
jgi:hypothetical protein